METRTTATHLTSTRTTMKKIPNKKLNLNKITVAVLSDNDLRAAAGGRAAMTKASICDEQCCETGTSVYGC